MQRNLFIRSTALAQRAQQALLAVRPHHMHLVAAAIMVFAGALGAFRGASFFMVLLSWIGALVALVHARFRAVEDRIESDAGR